MPVTPAEHALRAAIWLLLGEARSKCEHITGVPLRPETAEQLYRLDSRAAAAIRDPAVMRTAPEEAVSDGRER
jgi:hypothetical protein